jgi:glycosyltransferase involved in cell wall biosynthesis
LAPVQPGHFTAFSPFLGGHVTIASPALAILLYMDTFAVLCVTDQHHEQMPLLTEALAIATERDPSLLVTVGDESATTELFKTAKLLVCVGSDPAAEEAICRAQALGLPVLAVAGGRAEQLIENGRSGFIVAGNSVPLADTIRWLAHRTPVRERLRTGGLLAAGARLALSA